MEVLIVPFPCKPLVLSVFLVSVVFCCCGGFGGWVFVVVVVVFCHFNGCEVLPHHFNLHFPDDSRRWTSFHTLPGQVSSFVNCFKSFGPFLNKLWKLFKYSESFNIDMYCEFVLPIYGLPFIFLMVSNERWKSKILIRYNLLTFYFMVSVFCILINYCLSKVVSIFCFPLEVGVSVLQSDI